MLNPNAEALTPFRRTEVVLDYAEDVPSEPTYTLRRERGEIKPVSTSGVMQLASGVCSLALDRILEAPIAGTGIEQPMTGYHLILGIPGLEHAQADVIAGFYFGGPIYSDGYGQFHITVFGDGRLRLKEYYQNDWHHMAT